MSSGDFEAELEQSVQDHLAFVANAGKVAKARIGQGIESGSAPAPATQPNDPRPAVDFNAPEPAPVPLPEGAISFDDLAVEGVDDEGIPVWEDPP